MLPGGGFAFHADYAHEGADLVITGADGSKVVVVDYFAGSEPADLMTLDGHHLAGSLVDSLAGPIAPAQYAQAADTQTADVPAAVPEIGQVESIEGTITATGADGVKVDLAAGSSVFQGDVLETSSDGAVNIVFMDGTTFSLGADAKMVLDELIYDASSNTGSSIMSVVTGTFVFITGQVAKLGPDAMKVNTPSGTIGIRGTKVACNLEIADGQSICVLLPEEDGTVGEFIFTNESGSQGVSNAYEAIIANTFNASLIVTQVLPDQLGSLFEGLLPGVLETEAPPVVLGQGGTFFDFLAGRGNAAQGLQTSGVLDDQEGLALLTGGTVPEQDPQSLAVAASLFIAEPAVDGPGTLSTGNLSLVLAQSITLTGFSVTANGSPVALTSGGVPVILTQDGNTVEGFAGGELIFRFTLNPETGDVTVFLAQPLDHLDTSATGTSDTIEFSFEVEVVFIDGSSQTVLVQANVLDAGPTATTTSNAVDEATDIDAPATGNLAIVAGNDGLDSVELTGVTATDGGGIIPLTSGGEAITLTSLGGGTFQGVTSGDTVVFEITFDAATGDYSFTLLEPLDQPSDGADSITLTFDMVVTDGDGDSVTSTIVIDVTDDVVVAADDDGGTVTEGDPAVAGNVITNDDLGSDGLGGITQFVHDGVVYTTESAGGAVQSNDGTTIVIMTALDGIFTFNFETGAYSYVAPDSVDNTGGDPIETFVYTIADGDGDTDTAMLTIAVADVNAPTANPDSETLDEAAGDGAGFTNIVKSGSLIGDDDPGLDGFGAVKIAGVTYDGGLGAADKSEDATTITYTGAGWTLVIDKLTGDYTFTQTDAFPHDAIQGTNDAIGTFTYTLQDLDGTTDNSTLTITITDDIIAAFDDDGGAIQEGAAGTLTGSVLDNDDSGVDGFGAVLSFEHNGEVYSLESTALQAGFVSLVGTVITITTELDGTLVFDFATGEYSYTAPATVDNTGGDPVETFVYTVADGDGDTDSATLTITVTDSNAPAANPDTETLNEAAGDPADLGDGSAFTPIVKSGSLIDDDSDGGDGFGDPAITGVVYDDGLGAATVDEDATTITFTGDGWTLVIDKSTGDYTFTQTDAFQHELVQGTNDVAGVFTYTVQDIDGSTSSSALTITITDDVIVATDDDGGTVDEGSATSGNLLTNDDSGVDGFGGITQVLHNGVIYTPDEDGMITIVSALGGTFVLDTETGEYTYDAPEVDAINADGVELFRYTVIDGDGDFAEATLTIDVDDVPQALDDQNAATEGGASVFGNVILENDIVGDGPGRVTQISFTTLNATAAAFYMALAEIDEDIVVTEDGGVFTITVSVDEGGSKTFTTLAGGELTINSDGSYEYVPPPEGALRDDATETFIYTIADGDGDTDTATLTITVDDVIEPAGAFLVTNTNAGLQDLRIIVTSNDAEVVGSGIPSTAGGQEGTVQLGNGGGVLFEETESYAVIVKFEAGSGTTNLTNLDLIFDLEAADLDDPDNVFLTLLDQGNVQLGDQGSSVDGVIWQIEFNEALSEFEASDAILYDIQSDPVLGDVVVFDTDLSNTSFVLDFGLLPTDGNVLLAENALFGDIEVLDISGSNNEANTLILTAQDVIDVTDGGDRLIVLGDDDTLVLEDGDDWHLESSGVTVAGSDETFNLYMATSGAELLVDDDLTVVFETAMA